MMFSSDKRRSEVAEAGSLTEWKSEVLPMFDSLSRSATCTGAASRLKAVIAHLTPDTIGPFIMMTLDTFKVQQLYAWKEAMGLLKNVTMTQQGLLAGRIELMNKIYTSLARYIAQVGVTPTMVSQVSEALPDVTKALLSSEVTDDMTEEQKPSLSMWLAPFYEKVRAQERQMQLSATACVYAIIKNAPEDYFLSEAENLTNELVTRLKRTGCVSYDNIYACLTITLTYPSLHDVVRPYADTLTVVSIEAVRSNDFRTRFAASKFLTLLNVTYPDTCRAHINDIVAVLERCRYDRNVEVRSAVKETLRSLGRDGPNPTASAPTISLGASGPRHRSGSSTSSGVSMNISSIATRHRTSSNGSSSSSCSAKNSVSSEGSDGSMQPPRKKKPHPFDGHWAARLEINPQHVYKRLSLVEVEQMGIKETTEKYMAEKDAEIAQLRARVTRLEEALLRLLHDDLDDGDASTKAALEASVDEEISKSRHSLTTRESSAWITAMKCVGNNQTCEQGFSSFLDDCDLSGASTQRRRELQTRLLRLMQVAGPERSASLSLATLQRMLSLLFAESIKLDRSSTKTSESQQEDGEDEEEGEEQQNGTASLFNEDDFTATVMPWLEQLADQEKIISVDDVRDPATSARLRAYLESILHQQPPNVFRNVAERILSTSHH